VGQETSSFVTSVGFGTIGLVVVGDEDAEGEIVAVDEGDPEGDDGALAVAASRLDLLFQVSRWSL
jgi:hypothetical protein